MWACGTWGHSSSLMSSSTCNSKFEVDECNKVRSHSQQQATLAREDAKTPDTNTKVKTYQYQVPVPGNRNHGCCFVGRNKISEADAASFFHTFTALRREFAGTLHGKHLLLAACCLLPTVLVVQGGSSQARSLWCRGEAKYRYWYKS
jgi:hypothetical protein